MRLKRLTLADLVLAMPSMMDTIMEDEGIEAAVILVVTEREDRYAIDLCCSEGPEVAARLIHEVDLHAADEFIADHGETLQ